MNSSKVFTPPNLFLEYSQRKYEEFCVLKVAMPEFS